jgi:hypothetical protein
MPNTFRKYGFIGLLTLILTNPFSAAMADYKSNYLAALEYIGAREWNKAQALLNKIDEFEQQESAKLTNTSDSRPYLPKYYAGLVSFNLGLCQKAESNLISSLAQQIIKGYKSEFSLLKKMRTVCKSRLNNGKYVDRLGQYIKPINSKVNQLNAGYNQLVALRKSTLFNTVWKNNTYLRNQDKGLKKQFESIRQESYQLIYLEYTKDNIAYIRRLSNKADLHAKAMNDYQQKLSQYITALNKIQNKASRTQAKVDSLFALRNNEILADDWSKSGSLTQGFKKQNSRKKMLAEEAKALFVVNKESDLKNNVSKAVTIISQLERVDREVNTLLGQAKSKIKQGNLRLEKEKRLVYAGVDAFFLGQYTVALDLLLNAEISESKGLYYKYLFISAAYFYIDDVSREKANEYKLLAKKTDTKVELNEIYFSPKFIAFYRQD